MRVAASEDEARGSLKWIRAAVNDRQSILDRHVVESCGLAPDITVEWVSPLASDDYAEYRDHSFLNRLGVELTHRSLEGFWPRLGPQWDALARTSDGQYLLVEAKANIPEIVSSKTGASGHSRTNIEASLEETKRFLGIDETIPWSGRRLYQYANRLAHLYLLRELNKIPARLVFVYFVGDKAVNGPETIAEWKAALTVAKLVLGIGKQHRRAGFVHDVFIDVSDLEPSSSRG